MNDLLTKAVAHVRQTHGLEPAETTATAAHYEHNGQLLFSLEETTQTDVRNDQVVYNLPVVCYEAGPFGGEVSSSWYYNDEGKVSWQVESDLRNAVAWVKAHPNYKLPGRGGKQVVVLYHDGGNGWRRGEKRSLAEAKERYHVRKTDKGLYVNPDNDILCVVL